MDTTNPKKILVVEDEFYLRDLYVKILSDEGYAVDQAADGEAGYQLMIKGGYDLVLLDLILPKMDGMAILKKLKDEIKPQLPNKAIVILSNLDQFNTIAEGTSFGIRGYMIKSNYTPDQIIKEVKNYLNT